MDAKTNGAMPVSRVPDEIDHERNFYQYGTEGLTKRELFAAMAMQGLLANSGGPYQTSARSGWTLVNCTHEQVADECLSIADSLLFALSEPPK